MKMMSSVFHCYEFLLLQKLDEDEDLWNELKEKFIKEKERYIRLQNIPPELWFLAITLEKTKDRFPSFVKKLSSEMSHQVPLPSGNLLSRYLAMNEFVELHLDSIFKYGEGGRLPRELFKCPNVRAVSLKYNFLENLPADIGRLQRLEYLALTNNRLQNSSIPYTLTFCCRLKVLLLDNNLLDALPGFLLKMPSLQTVHRHGNHNYFKATFMWYHTDVNDRILAVNGSPSHQSIHQPDSLQYLSAQAVIAAKINFYNCSYIPSMLMDYISDMYFKFNICGNCTKAELQAQSGYKVFTFKNPYLGNTCVPFQHWACCIKCAEKIEVPARIEQIISSQEQDRQYHRYIQEEQDRCRYRQRHNAQAPITCCLF